MSFSLIYCSNSKQSIITMVLCNKIFFIKSFTMEPECTPVFFSEKNVCP
jgi:hypothetical protein